MITYVFSGSEVGNSFITANQQALSFRIDTERGFLGRRKKTVLASLDSSGSSIDGMIDWKQRTMTIMNHTKPLRDVKARTALFSMKHEWHWSTQKYVTTFKNGTCKLKNGLETIAVLTLPQINPFKNDQPGTLTVIPELSREETIFLILAIVYPAIKHPPPQPATPRQRAAARAALNLSNNMGVFTSNAVGRTTDAAILGM